MYFFADYNLETHFYTVDRMQNLVYLMKSICQLISKEWATSEKQPPCSFNSLPQPASMRSKQYWNRIWGFSAPIVPKFN